MSDRHRRMNLLNYEQVFVKLKSSHGESVRISARGACIWVPGIIDLIVRSQGSRHAPDKGLCFEGKCDQVTTWKAQLLDGGNVVFERKNAVNGAPCIAAKRL